MKEPGRLQSLGSQRVGHDWVSSLSFFLLSLKTEKREICAEMMILQILILLNPFSPTLFKSSSPVLCSGNTQVTREEMATSGRWTLKVEEDDRSGPQCEALEIRYKTFLGGKYLTNTRPLDETPWWHPLIKKAMSTWINITSERS